MVRGIGAVWASDGCQPFAGDVFVKLRQRSPLQKIRRPVPPKSGAIVTFGWPYFVASGQPAASGPPWAPSSFLSVPSYHYAPGSTPCAVARRGRWFRVAPVISAEAWPRAGLSPDIWELSPRLSLVLLKKKNRILSGLLPRPRRTDKSHLSFVFARLCGLPVMAFLADRKQAGFAFGREDHQPLPRIA